jgi:hypothetical protein
MDSDRIWSSAFGLGLMLASASGCVSQLPDVGDIRGHLSPEAPKVDSPRFGKSHSVPGVLEIKIDERNSHVGGVGRKVKRTFFADTGPLVFNVVFSCGKPRNLRHGRYGDPRSIWFNVFFGYYEIDVPQSSWSHPFGYRFDANRRGVFEASDLAKIGKADWNYFSNYMYGVPEAAILPYNVIQPGALKVKTFPRVRIGDTYWDELEIDGVEVVSAYVSRADNGKLVKNSRKWTQIWRHIFGRKTPRPEFTKSFFPTRMRAHVYAAYKQLEHDADLGERAYSTLIFGATVNADYPDASANEAFMQAQLASIRGVIEKQYRAEGFAQP